MYQGLSNQYKPSVHCSKCSLALVRATYRTTIHVERRFPLLLKVCSVLDARCALCQRKKLWGTTWNGLLLNARLKVWHVHIKWLGFFSFSWFPFFNSGSPWAASFCFLLCLSPLSSFFFLLSVRSLLGAVAVTPPKKKKDKRTRSLLTYGL